MNFTKNKKLMQYQLLELALEEAGILNAEIEVDHVKGLNRVNGLVLELKYPHSFIEHIKTLSTEKLYNYGFKGTTTFGAASLNRNKILEKFNTPDNIIVSTNVGIKRKNKKEFDRDYYQLLANSKYSLCPNWGGVHWDHEYAWTYRFIEAAFCKSIPIVFDETPLGSNNTKDILHFKTSNLPDLTNEEYLKIVEDNYLKAINYWTLTSDEIVKLK
jgi:hypothetical protein